MGKPLEALYTFMVHKCSSNHILCNNFSGVIMQEVKFPLKIDNEESFLFSMSIKLNIDIKPIKPNY